MGLPTPLLLRRILLALLVGSALAPAQPLMAGPSCPGDVDGDGQVAVTDLLRVLAAWGPYAPCPPLALEDLNGDCTVDVQDLLELLAAWGPCPTGACCLPGGGCVETTAADCRSLMGTFLGDGTRCPAGACGAGVVGACCLPNGTCVEVDVPACRARGGIYQGVGVVCAPGLCP